MVIFQQPTPLPLISLTQPDFRFKTRPLLLRLTLSPIVAMVNSKLNRFCRFSLNAVSQLTTDESLKRYPFPILNLLRGHRVCCWFHVVPG